MAQTYHAGKNQIGKNYRLCRSRHSIGWGQWVGVTAHLLSAPSPTHLLGVMEGRGLVLGLEAADSAIPSHHHPPEGMVNTPALRLAAIHPTPSEPLKLPPPLGRVRCPPCTTYSMFPSLHAIGGSQYKFIKPLSLTHSLQFSVLTSKTRPEANRWFKLNPIPN